MAKKKVPYCRVGYNLCKKCGEEKSVDEFLLEPRSSLGITARCRACINASNQEYRINNKDKVAISRKKYAEKFPERIAASRQYTNRRLSLERREARIANGVPLIEPKVTDEGRLCSHCRRRKPRSDFPPNAKYDDGLSYYCRDCVNKKGREQTKKPKTSEYRKRYMRVLTLKQYGMSITDFDDMVAKQDGKCGVCSGELRFGTGGCAVDHDHETKVVRGLLCRLCNIGIGHFRDDPALLSRAIDYLMRFRS